MPMIWAADPLPADTWRTARLVRRIDHAPDLYTLELDARIEPFVAGQFVQLGGFLDGAWVQRAYSLASPPGETPAFYIARVPDGQLSVALSTLEPGQPVAHTWRAAGQFTLERVPSAPVLWLLATGTGLAPYLSMLGTAEPWERFGRVIVVHGVRRASELAWAERFQAWEAEHPGRLLRIGCVTRAPEAPGVLHGRIPQLLDRVEEAAGARFDPERSQVLLCGNPAMIEEMEALLQTRGLRRNRRTAPGQVTVERYW